jgi:hypothetical protein
MYRYNGRLDTTLTKIFDFLFPEPCTFSEESKPNHKVSEKTNKYELE